MHSYKYNKLRDEKRKARRIVRSRVAKIYARYPELKYKGDIILKRPLSFRQRMAEKLQSISFKNIFKRK